MLVLFLLCTLLGVNGSDSLNLDNVVYVSRTYGQSKDDCGSKTLPCKAFQDGIDKLAWGGVLYIDGDQTTTDPYSCESSAGRVVAKKSLHVQSYNAMAEISCPNGFTISADNGSIGLDVTITGVQFKNTVLYLRNVPNVVIQDCTFLESSPAIDAIRSNDSLFYSLTITRTLFKRNRGCIFLQDQSDSKNRRFSTATLKLTNVTLEENIASKDSEAKPGLVFINLTNCNSNPSFQSTWENVIATRNSLSNETTESSKSFFLRKSNLRDPFLNSLYVVYSCNASLTFHQVRSESNIGLRFLGLTSRECSVHVYESYFYGHRISGPGGVMYIPDVYFIDVGISNSDFTKNVATVGGVIQIDGGDSKTAIMTLSNVNIRKCYGAIIGCAISIGHDNKQGIANLYAVLNSVSFDRCYHQDEIEKPYYGPLCLNGTLKTGVTMNNCYFYNNLNGGAAVASITHSPFDGYGYSMFNLQVTKSHFDENDGGFFTPTVIVYVENPWPFPVRKSRLLISDTVFTNNHGNAITVVNVQDITIHNFTCKHTIGFCCRFENYEAQTMAGLNANLIIEKSTFSNNSKSIYAEYIQPELVNIQVQDTVFKDNRGWGQVSFIFGSIMGPIRNPLGRVLFERVYFISNKQNEEENQNQLLLIEIPSFHDGNLSFIFRHSVFKDNFDNQTDYTNSGYQEKSLFVFKVPEDGPPDSCSTFCRRPQNSTYQTDIIYRHYLILKEVIFENNTGASFIVYIANGKISIIKCLFKNNFSHKPKSGAHLYIQDGTANVELDNTTFVQTTNYYRPVTHEVSTVVVYATPFMFAGASEPLVIRNSKFTSEDTSERVIAQLTIQSKGDVYVDKFTELSCPIGSYMDIENSSHDFIQNGYAINITRIKFICKMCAVGRYTLERGSYKGGLSSTKCIAFCPFGADCTWNIQSRPNFWGYYTSTDPPQLNFTRCHEKYCHVPKSLYTNTSVYNACYGNRTGIMCGACKEGFTESMFNHKCRPNEECQDVWFWVIAGLYSILMACYFLYRPPVLLYLVKNLLWFKKKKTSAQNGTREEEEESKEHDGHGYSKIIFYFYQVADLLMLESASEILHSYNLISSVLSFYSFQIELADSKLGCPFPGLTAVTKELFRSAQVFAVMAFILVFYFLHWLLTLFRTKSRPDFAPYLAAIVEVLLLGYERLGHTSLILLNCVPIKVRGIVEWRLVLDGNVVCWSHWWQYCLIAYNVIFVIPFLLVLLMGTSRLRSQRITAVQFVAACFVPLPFVAYWSIKMCFTRRESSETHDITTPGVIPENPTSEALLEVLQGPFRPPDHQSRGAYYWESILIGRRLIFLCLYSFVSTPMLRMLFMTTVCFAIPFHNVIVKPYKDRKTNAFAIIMLFFHVALAIINLCKSVFITIGVTAEGPTRSQIDGLQLFEVALLGFLPCVFVILVVATVVSQVLRLLTLILRMFRRCIMYITRRSSNSGNDHIHRALSNPTEEDSILYNEIQ